MKRITLVDRRRKKSDAYNKIHGIRKFAWFPTVVSGSTILWLCCYWEYHLGGRTADGEYYLERNPQYFVRHEYRSIDHIMLVQDPIKP